jgi:microcystin-dependent protein
MASPFVGEIRLFAGNFAPQGWLFCDGQLLPISENDALFNLIGTTYGGDGQSTFALPDLRGRVPNHQGTSPSFGTNYIIGEMSGVEEITLTTQQLPVHTHPAVASTNQGTQGNPGGNVLSNSQGAKPYIEDAPTNAMSAASVTAVGGSQPHTNLQPFICINYIISLFGVFPQQF